MLAFDPFLIMVSQSNNNNKNELQFNNVISLKLKHNYCYAAALPLMQRPCRECSGSAANAAALPLMQRLDPATASPSWRTATAEGVDSPS